VWFERYDLSQVSEDLLQTRGRSALYLMTVLEVLLDLEDPDLEEERERAEDLRPGFWRDLWDRVAVDSARIVVWVQSTDGDGKLLVFSPDGIERISATDPRIPQYLPDPGDEWKLTIEYKDGSVSGA